MINVDRTKFRKKYFYYISIFSIFFVIVTWKLLEVKINTENLGVVPAVIRNQDLANDNIDDKKSINHPEIIGTKTYSDPFREQLALQKTTAFIPNELTGNAKNIDIDPFKEKLNNQANDAKMVTISPFGEIIK